MTIDLSSAREELNSNSKRRGFALLAVIAGGAIVVAGAIALAVTTAPSQQQLDWPAVGSAAVVRGEEVLLSPDADTSRPIGSLAKLVTALVVLDRIPLEPRSTGPAIQLTATDTAYFAEEQANGGQTLSVSEGEVVSVRELLECVLVASSNNHARSLATHVFGDEIAYQAAARSWLRDHDLDDVTIADATGMSPATSASAADMLAIARLAEMSPVISEIAAMPELERRGTWPVKSANDLLGTFGIDGLKTGYTDAAGYTIVFTTEVDGEPVVGVLLGSPSRAQRTTDVTRLIAQLKSD